MNMKSMVCTMGNKLVKDGYIRSQAFQIAWEEVKRNAVVTRSTKQVEKKVEIVDYVKEYKKLQAMIEELQTKANAVKESIVEVIEAQQTEELQVDIFKVRYITVVSNRFNTTDFKKTQAELYNEYLKESTCKRFRGLNATKPHR